MMIFANVLHWNSSFHRGYVDVCTDRFFGAPANSLDSMGCRDSTNFSGFFTGPK